MPALQVDPYRGMTPHFRVAAARARALHGAVSGIGAHHRGLCGCAVATNQLARADAGRLDRARVGSEIEPQRLADLLVDGGFTREDPVEEHGAFAIRGGIVDVFPATAMPNPCAWSSWATWSKRSVASIPRHSDRPAPTDHVQLVPARERFDDG